MRPIRATTPSQYARSPKPSRWLMISSPARSSGRHAGCQTLPTAGACLLNFRHLFTASMYRCLFNLSAGMWVTIPARSPCASVQDSLNCLPSNPITFRLLHHSL